MASELTWRRLSETEKKEIEEKSKKLILEFGKIVESLSLDSVGEEFAEREKFSRKENSSNFKENRDFKKMMLKNAPNKNSDCVIAEKGEWVGR